MHFLYSEKAAFTVKFQGNAYLPCHINNILFNGSKPSVNFAYNKQPNKNFRTSRI